MDRLDAVQWMEKSSRSIAVQKVRAVVDKIGYPTWMANDDVIDQMYSSVSLPKAFYRSAKKNVTGLIKLGKRCLELCTGFDMHIQLIHKLS